MDPTTLAAVLAIVQQLLQRLTGQSAAAQATYVAGVNAALAQLSTVKTQADHAAAAKALALAIAGEPPSAV